MAKASTACPVSRAANEGLANQASRVDAAAISLPDVFMCRGSYVFNPELPFTPGQEVSGTVVAAGENAQTAI
ncbi:MAG: alcohol dehydrogenase catalytic domain-containing protein, partial [Deltaproteobacteria bacterium]|nr:alcohol dehydrogenase catalytic domain-containing protein [Deltaproteobacteria bacterium]